MEGIYNNGEKLINEVYKTKLQGEGAVSFWSLGQAGVLIKGKEEDGWICIDPYLSSSIEMADPSTEFKRAFPPVISPEMLRNPDGVLVTHVHDDHLDMATVTGIAAVSADTCFAVPAPLESMVKQQLTAHNVLPARDHEGFIIKGFKITPVPAAHTEYETDSLGNYSQLGYFIEVNGIRLFHSGDTVITKDLIERVRDFRPHVAFLPINGADYFRTARGIIGNMTFREAADFSVAVGVDLVVPIHFDMFPNNRENPAYFVDYLFHQYPTQKFHMLVPGERFIYFK